jgi:hypothetical protein
MNDLPENELLSAYLDGELTAAERAEVERLLAANPAARQLLDELRTLSATLRALPPQTLGEDLSRQVLRVAERRMLTEGEPGHWTRSPTPAVPRARAVFNRFVNRRTLVWLSLTAAIAVMIAINERQHRAPRVDKGDREVAVARGRLEDKAAIGPVQPPSIQAAPNRLDEVVNKAKSADQKPVAEKKIERASTPAAPKAASPGKRPAAKSSEKSGAELAVRNIVGEEGQLGAGGPSPAKGGPIGKAGQHVGKAGRSAGKAGQVTGKASGRSADKKKKDKGVLVVYCDISPEAAKSLAFHKLLEANGVVWGRQRGQRAPGMEADQEQTPAPGEAAPGEVVVYAEGTRAQFKAVLAGLEAQPDVFLAMSVEPAQGQTPQDGFAQLPQRRAAGQRKSAAGGEQELQEKERPPAKGRTGDAAKRPGLAKAGSSEAAPEGTEAGAAAPAPGGPSGAGESPRDGRSAEEQRQMRLQSQREQVDQSVVPRQRIMFVLRVVGGGQSAAPAGGEAKEDAGSPKPAELPVKNAPRQQSPGSNPSSKNRTE